jgi:hypothetical protein
MDHWASTQPGSLSLTTSNATNSCMKHVKHNVVGCMTQITHEGKDPEGEHQIHLLH